MIFSTGWFLEFDEILKQKRTEVEKVKYRYHLMDKSKKLIFRYDNVPHHPEIKTHPHHKHINKEITESYGQDLIKVIEEIEKLVIKSN